MCTTSIYQTPEWQKKIRNILTDLRQSRCVLLIGPEIARIGTESLRMALRNHLNQTNAEDIAHYYDRDGFYLFRDKVAKEDVQREVVLFYEENHTGTTVDEAIFKRVLQIKFPLVLSINPDNFLSDAAYKYGVKHRFTYFHHSGEAVQEVEEPTVNTPLFYNLCGFVERDNSLILDYDDLFQLLSALLGTPGLPAKLAVTLQQAKHFLFLGFDFDKWYSQLLLRLLSGEKAIRKFAIDRSVKGENTTTFLVKQFGIEFIEHETDFFNEFFERCAAEDLLRDLVENNSPERVQITRWVANNNLPKAFDLLRNVAKNQQQLELENAVVLLQARFHDLQARESRKTLDSRDYQVEYNRIVDALFELTKDQFSAP